MQQVAGDVAGLRRHEEGDGFGDIVGCAQPSQRDACELRLQRGGSQGRLGSGVFADVAGNHGVHRHAAHGQLQGQRADQGFERRLGCGGRGEGRHVGTERMGDEAADRNDPGLLTRPQMRHGGAGEAQERQADGVHRERERRVGEVCHRRAVGEAGVADDHVQAAEPRHCRVNQGTGDHGVREVAQVNQGNSLARLDFGGNTGGALGVAAGADDDRDARPGQPATGRGANSAGRSGHEDHAPYIHAYCLRPVWRYRDVRIKDWP